MNKKKILIVIALSAIASFSLFHLKMNTNESRLTDVSLENVDALAQESGNPPDCFQAKGFCVDETYKDNYMSFEK